MSSMMEAKYSQPQGTKRGRSRGRSRTPKRVRTMVPAVQVSRRPEIKLVDVHLQSLPFDSSGGNIFLLNVTQQGAAETQRIGRKISMKSVMIRYWVNQFQGGAAPAKDFLRMLLVYDRQPNGAVPALADILQDVDYTSATATNALSSLNISNADRFKVVRDWCWKVDTPGGNVVGNQPATVSTDFKEFCGKAFCKMPGGWEVHYNGTNGGTIADFTTGALYLVTAGQNTNANTQYQCTFTTRVRYSDS